MKEEHETHLPTEQQASQTDARLSRTDEDQGRPEGAQAAPGKGAQTADRLGGRFPRRERLTRSADIQALFQQGKRIDRPSLTVLWRPSGEGPRVLVVGGTHGDEFEGQFAASSLVRKLPSLELLGSITVLPRHHPAACFAGMRVSPIDGANLNRLYTGRPTAGRRTTPRRTGRPARGARVCGDDA